MSGPLAPVPADDFVLPVPTSQLEDQQAGRRSTDSSWSQRSRNSADKRHPRYQEPLRGVWRHTIGIILLLATVILWTASNFLASTIFADDSYSKPYFVTYVNSSFFSILLLQVAARRLWASNGSLQGAIRGHGSTHYVPMVEEEEQTFVQPDDEGGIQEASRSPHSRLLIEEPSNSPEVARSPPDGRLKVRETLKLSFEFCILWFLANYFVAACLEYTTVASSTILTSTSSVWTLIFGSLLSVEKFTVKKLIGVLASLAGIILISSIDMTGNQDKNRGSFPHKSHKEIAIGDVLAFTSAVMYGIYTTLMKKRIGDESRVDIPLFFGFVGLFNFITLLPGFFVLHFTGIETFELPPTKRILAIVLINSATSLVSDLCWAYSMLLTSPLVVTVGLSLTIPLSLIGQMIEYSQTSSISYWIGACIVLLSFVFINHESSHDEATGKAKEEDSFGAPRSFLQRTWDRIRPQRQ
ncbi:hypothetical protein IMSHALPRED_006696 [Imshaugia aleurites]|uniref:EamA domain-containing protein n=1 Tax=Imshaugia aleurites TaxID=172621 RepID=A0A8H3EKS7_9LECA|nr:hypothetical protein IMSHALPRED_006696 [Imshaugia aleurites]